MIVKIIRYQRILKYLLFYFFRNDVKFLYEVEHYYYMKSFKKKWIVLIISKIKVQIILSDYKINTILAEY